MVAHRLYSDEELIDAIQKTKSLRAAANLLGVDPAGVCKRRDRLVRKGWSPEHGWTKLTPPGFEVSGITELTGPDNEVKLRWTRIDREQEQLHQAFTEFVQGLKEEIKGLAEPVKAPKKTLADSLSAYIIGDAHFGMYSWGAETGDDFDTDIASRDLRAAIDLLVDGAPASETGFLVDVGDFMHADSRINSTPASGNQLDVDSRFPRVARIARDALRYCIGKMLRKHKKVRFYSTPGNHNPNSAGWMAMVLEAYYHNEPRVEVEMSPSTFYYYRFGKVLLGITHGDKVKPQELPSIMAADRPADWGKTELRHWLTGHVHHTRFQEYRGAFVESFNTLAGSDAWHHSSGYRSQRQMQRIDYDKEFGIYNRGIATLKMIR